MSSSLKLGATVLAAVGLAALGYFYLQSRTSSSSKTSSTSATDDEKTPNSSPRPSEIPTIDLDIFANPNRDPEAYQRECAKVAYALHHFGLVIVKDRRVSEEDNNRFLDMMEQYFEGSDGIRDARPKIGYQIGVTGERIEKPRNFCNVIGAYGPDDKPLSPCPPEFDLKWRFFWRTGPQPTTTEFPLMNADPVIPTEFPQWREVMDMWGGKMTDALFTFAEMAAVGFKMAPDAFTSRLMYGPHLLAPTGSDFKKYNQINSVLAGYHYDLNFLTIHGKSRFPGLSVWTRDGRKMSVNIPDGCLLVQAGKQIEYLTGGEVLAGFHEVVINDKTVEAIQRRTAENKSLWRVSSTCFGHIQSDQVLEPLPPFNNAQALAKFPPIKAGEQVRKELEAISLLAR